MLVLDRQDFGKFYVSLRRGQRGEFVNCIIRDCGGSYNCWRSKLVNWAKGKLERKPLPRCAKISITELMALEHWERMM